MATVEKHLERARGILAYERRRSKAAVENLERAIKSECTSFLRDATRVKEETELLIELLEEYVRKWESAQEETLAS